MSGSESTILDFRYLFRNPRTEKHYHACNTDDGSANSRHHFVPPITKIPATIIGRKAKIPHTISIMLDHLPFPDRNPHVTNQFADIGFRGCLCRNHFFSAVRQGEQNVPYLFCHSDTPFCGFSAYVILCERFAQSKIRVQFRTRIFHRTNPCIIPL